MGLNKLIRTTAQDYLTIIEPGKRIIN